MPSSAWMIFVPQFGSGECWSAVLNSAVIVLIVLMAVFVVPVSFACSSRGYVTVIWSVMSSLVYMDALSSWSCWWDALSSLMWVMGVMCFPVGMGLVPYL